MSSNKKKDYDVLDQSKYDRSKFYDEKGREIKVHNPEVGPRQDIWE